MRSLEHLKMMLEKEIEKVTAKGAIAPAEIEAVYKVVDIIKDIDTISAMEDYDDDEYSGEYSRRGRRSYDYSYRRGRDGRYANGGSYEMQRDRMMGMDY